MISRFRFAASIAILAGCLCAAGSIAVSAASSRQQIAAAEQARVSRHAAVVKRAAIVLKAERANCERLTGADKGNCRSEARAKYRLALRSTRKE